VDDVECKAQSLETTVDRLNMALDQSERDGNSRKDQVRPSVASLFNTVRP